MATATSNDGRLLKGRMGRKRSRKPPSSLTPWERRVAVHIGNLIGDRSGEVAAAVGVSRDAVLKWCAGDSFPTLDKWPKLAAALGLSDPGELLPPS